MSRFTAWLALAVALLGRCAIPIPALAADTGGPIFRDTCTLIPSPVTNRVLCWEQTTTTLKYWDGATWQPLTGATAGVTSLNGLAGAVNVLGTAGQLTVVTLAPNLTLALVNTIAAAGPIGDATHVPQITFDAKGRLTTVTSVLITGATPGGSAGGDLAGTYPNPSVAKVNAVAYPAGPATNTVPVVTGANTITYEAVPNAALANSTHTFTGAHGLTSPGAVALGGTVAYDLSAGGIANDRLTNSSITVTGTASQVTVSGSPVSLGGTVTLSLPATINVNTSGNAGTATALAADPADCASGTIALGINAAGTAQCTALPTVTAIRAIGVFSGVAASQVWLDQASSTTSRVVAFGPNNATLGIINLSTLSGNASLAGAGVTLQSGLVVGAGTDRGDGTLDVQTLINAGTGYRVANAAPLGQVLRGNGTNFVSATLAFSDLTGSATCAQEPARTGDVTAPAGSCANTIPAGQVTNAMLGGSIAASKLVGTDLATVGTVTVGTWNGTVIAGPYGGTGLSTAAVGDLLYASATTPTWSRLADVAAGAYLRSGGVNTAPLWSTVTLPNTAAQGDLLYGSATNVVSMLAKSASATRYLANTGTSNNPAWDQVNLANGVTGTLPIANGGTGDTGTAWTTYTPTVTCGSGTITTVGTVTGRYKTFGKTVVILVDAAITTIGTCGTDVRVTLPVATASAIYAFHGRESGVTGKGLTAYASSSSTMVITAYDATFLGASGYRYIMTGVYESS